MKAIVKTSAAPGAELIEVPEAAITQSNQVKVQVMATAICGTDYHIYAWDAWSAARVKPPRVMGHEFAGEVVEVGSDVSGVAVGDYVSGESHWTCGHCLQCRLNQRHVCANTRILGVDVDGCFAPLVVVPEGSVWKNDRSVPPWLACVQDPLGNAVHATLNGEIIGQTVVVLGCGPIGLFAIAVAKAAGASKIVATDTRKYRLNLAGELGATHTVDVTEQDAAVTVAEITAGCGADVVLEMSGAVPAIQQAMRFCRPGGRVSLMGIPTRTVEMDIAEIIFKGITVNGIVGRRLYETWSTMRALLASGRLDVAPAITHRLKFDQLHHGMDLMRDGLCGKVVFTMD
ncbi:MAG: L-threonine 3-dehydrogenase [Armatimonadetes bacterium]|nr:L-threonine 3-dehydrogenase [Armatimonadota bacterium]MDE2205803.1 L-threonine 3-dehydrogenase [Armatimonadota bacterium]